MSLLWIDTFYIKDIKRTTYAVFNLVCEGTRFGVQYAMNATRGVPSARTTFDTFCTVWCSWTGWPSVIRVDRGKEYMGEFAELCTQKGVEIDSLALEAPWQLGVAERRGGVFKYIWSRLVNESQLEGLDDIRAGTTTVTQTINDTENHHGFSPGQWVLASHTPRVPGVLLQPEEHAKLEVQEAAMDPTSAMSHSLSMRESARISRVRLDNDNRLRAAVTSKSTPTREDYPVGAYVYFRRVQDDAKGNECDHWFGAARVIGY